MQVVDFPQKSTTTSPDAGATIHSIVKTPDAETTDYVVAMVEALGETIEALPWVLRQYPTDVVGAVLASLFTEALAENVEALACAPQFDFDRPNNTAS